MINLILQYCRSGTINNYTNYSGPYLDCLEDCIPFIEDSIYSDDIRDRFHATNHLLVLLWKYIKPLIEETKEQMKQDEVAAKEALDERFKKQIQGTTPLPSGKGGKMPKQAEAGKKEQSTDPCLPYCRKTVRRNWKRYRKSFAKTETAWH